jgi:hypothetical protein
MSHASLAEARTPRALQDAVITVIAIAEKRVMPHRDQPARRPRLCQLAIEPLQLGVPRGVTHAVVIAVQHQHGEQRVRRVVRKIDPIVSRRKLPSRFGMRLRVVQLNFQLAAVIVVVSRGNVERHAQHVRVVHVFEDDVHAGSSILLSRA